MNSGLSSKNTKKQSKYTKKFLNCRNILTSQEKMSAHKPGRSAIDAVPDFLTVFVFEAFNGRIDVCPYRRRLFFCPLSRPHVDKYAFETSANTIINFVCFY